MPQKITFNGTNCHSLQILSNSSCTILSSTQIN
nr:MAG TPA: hypothetical protein [Caudoviricetes sp.]